MNKVTIDQIIRDEKNVAFSPIDSFNLSYPEFIKYFSGISDIKQHNLIIAANFTYGWMPTMFEFKSTKFDQILKIFNKVKSGNKIINISDLEVLSTALNNSVVGTSKMLHFINPNKYAIWDSRVYRYINKRDSYYDMIKPKNYFFTWTTVKN